VKCFHKKPGNTVIYEKSQLNIDILIVNKKHKELKLNLCGLRCFILIFFTAYDMLEYCRPRNGIKLFNDLNKISKIHIIYFFIIVILLHVQLCKFF